MIGPVFLIMVISVVIVTFAILYFLGLKKKFIHVWVYDYYFNRLKEKRGHRHIMFCFVDHYEPYQKNTNSKIAEDRVNYWVSNYPVYANKYLDRDGYHPKHTFFYPEEEYEEKLLDQLSRLCHDGYGEVEIHLHHDNETEAGFIAKVESFKTTLFEKHKLLYRHDDQIVFGFIHGNWALDNCGKDGKWCGLNNEITILKGLGCYADFTLPSGPNECQTSTVNSIYYAIDDPAKPKSHDKGIRVEVNKQTTADLMIIQGPISLMWGYRKFNIWPRIEYGDITPIEAIPIEARIDSWIDENIHVKGQPEWLFVKVHTHGGLEMNSESLFKHGNFDRLHQHLEINYNDKTDYSLHYVTAREMYNIVKAAENGETGNPNQFRDYVIKPFSS